MQLPAPARIPLPRIHHQTAEQFEIVDTDGVDDPIVLAMAGVGLLKIPPGNRVAGPGPPVESRKTLPNGLPQSGAQSLALRFGGDDELVEIGHTVHAGDHQRGRPTAFGPEQSDQVAPAQPVRLLLPAETALEQDLQLLAMPCGDLLEPVDRLAAANQGARAGVREQLA